MNEIVSLKIDSIFNIEFSTEVTCGDNEGICQNLIRSIFKRDVPLKSSHTLTNLDILFYLIYIYNIWYLLIYILFPWITNYKELS